MNDIEQINDDIHAVQTAVFNYEMAIYKAGYSIKELDDGYDRPVPATALYIASVRKAKEHLRNMERYFNYLTVEIKKRPRALGLKQSA